MLFEVLAENAGLDVQEAIVNVQDARIKTGGCLGLDLATGEATDTAALGVWDNYRVKKQYLHLSTVLATQLLLVDEEQPPPLGPKRFSEIEALSEAEVPMPLPVGGYLSDLRRDELRGAPNPPPSLSRRQS